MSTKKTTLCIIATIFLSFLFSCKNTNTSDSNSQARLDSLRMVFEKDQNDNNFALLAREYGQQIIANKDLRSREQLVVDALSISEKKDKHNMAVAFAYELIKINPKHPKSREYTEFIIGQMTIEGRLDAARILRSGLARTYPDNAKYVFILDTLPQWTKKIPDYIKQRAIFVRDKNSPTGINDKYAKEYVDICEAYALAYPKNNDTADQLFSAAEVAQSIQNLGKTISLYTWIERYFPQHKRAPMSLFLKGFLLDETQHNIVQAGQAYDDFLQKYPQDSLVNQVKLLKANLGKSADQIRKEVIAK